MKIAYLINAHAHPSLLNAVVEQRLRDPSADVYLHIDAKSEQLPEQVRTHPRLFMLEQRYDVAWGDISQIDATLALLAAAHEAGAEYDYYCYGSGQDLHVRPGFAEYLTQHNGQSFMTWKRDRPAPRNAFTAIRWPAPLKRNHKGLHTLRIVRSLLMRLARAGLVWRPNDRQLPDEHALYLGSAWFTFHRDAVEYLLRDNVHLTDLRDFFTPSLMPEERFFQTAMVNSPLASTLINDNLLYTVFSANSPKDLTLHDIPAIDASGKFIARKFNPTVDGEVIAHYAAV